MTCSLFKLAKCDCTTNADTEGEATEREALSLLLDIALAFCVAFISLSLAFISRAGRPCFTQLIISFTYCEHITLFQVFYISSFFFALISPLNVRSICFVSQIRVAVNACR